MKQILITVICILSVSLSAFGQTSDTFDISTFQAPKGWTKQVGQDAVQFSIADKDSFCLITLYKSLPSLGSPKENFDAAWSTIVKETVTVSAAPQMFPADTKGEWQVAGGYAPFVKSGEKGVVVLYTASG